MKVVPGGGFGFGVVGLTGGTGVVTVGGGSSGPVGAGGTGTSVVGCAPPVPVGAGMPVADVEVGVTTGVVGGAEVGPGDDELEQPLSTATPVAIPRSATASRREPGTRDAGSKVVVRMGILLEQESIPRRRCEMIAVLIRTTSADR
ncbi:hypothetical protein GCM10027167_44110 [Nocardia heshunensis]